QMVAQTMLRPVSREYDEREAEHAKPLEMYAAMWETLKAQNLAAYERGKRRSVDGEQPTADGKPKRSSTASMAFIHTIEALSWGDVGLYLSIPSSGLGGAAIEA